MGDRQIGAALWKTGRERKQAFVIPMCADQAARGIELKIKKGNFV